MERFWIFQDSKYVRFLHVQALHKVLYMPEYGWITPEQTVVTLTRFWICLVKVLNMLPVLKMTELGIWQRCDYARVTQGACWIYLNNPEYVLIMPQYAWIWLNNAEYPWICLHLSILTEFWMSLIQYIASGHYTNYWAVIEKETFRQKRKKKGPHKERRAFWHFLDFCCSYRQIIAV